MTPEQWQQVKDILEQALKRDAAERNAFLDHACAGDVELRRRVDALLASDRDMGEFLSQPLGAPLDFTGSGDGSRAGAIQPLPSAEPSGKRIGPYQILREIGRGGMGAVYLAERADGLYRKRVAVKLVKSPLETGDLMRRFRIERQVMATMDHPNIARLLDAGETGAGLSFLVMEYVEGERVDAWCDNRKLPVRNRLELFRSVCAAVQYAHDHQVIHRDLKPSNILVMEDGTPKLLDFGIAKVLDSDLFGTTLQSTVGPGPMTPEYASPEQVRGERVGPASDIYALGLVLYRLLTGQHPYSVQSSDLREVPRVICEQEPLKPSDAILSAGRGTGTHDTGGTVVTPESVSAARGETAASLHRRLAGNLDNVVLKALRKDAERRYASAAQLAADLDRLLHDLPVQARKETLRYRASKFLKRNRSPVITGILSSALLLAVVGALNRFGWFDDMGTLGPQSLAVVQIENLTQDPSLDWLERGLCELLTTNLSGIQVISAERIRELLGRQSRNGSHLPDALLREVAREAHADLFLNGALTGRGKRVRLDLRVQETATGRVVFSNKVEGPGAQSIFTMAGEAAEGIERRLAPRERARKPLAHALTGNLEALKAYEEGVSAATRFDNAGTTSAFHRALDLDPQFVQAHYRLADALRFYGNLPEARRMIAQAVRLAENTSVPRLQKLLAQALQLRMDFRIDEAANLLETAHREFPRETDPPFQLANLRSTEGRFAEAAALYEEVIRMDERHALAHDQLGYQYALQDNLARGIASIDRYAALLPPGNEVPFASRADAYLINEHYAEAIQQYQKIQHNLPMAAAAAFGGDYSLAESTLAHVRRQRVGWHEAAGDLAAAQGQLDQAAVQYEQAAEMYQAEGPLRVWWALLKTARIFLEQHDPEGVVALSRRHESPWSAGLRGTAFLLLDRQAAAEKEFAALRQSVSPILGDYLAEKSIEFHRMLAASYAGHFDQVIQMWPGLPRYFWSLYALDVGRAYLQSGVVTEAQYHLRAASKAQLAFFWNGDMQARHDLLTWMLAQFYMGQAMEKAGRQSEAIADYQSFLKHFAHSSARLPQIAVARAVLARSQFSERGELILHDDFAGATLQPGWSGGTGNWQVAGGFLKGFQPAGENHAARRTHSLEFRDAIFELSFRLEQARMISLVLSNQSGLACALNVKPDITWWEFEPDPEGNRKPETLPELIAATKPGIWHKLLVEVNGRRMIAQVDGKQTIAAQSAQVDVNKTGFGLAVYGTAASFDYLRVYRLRPHSVRD